MQQGKQEMSTLEIAMIADVTERSVQRWLSDGTLQAQHVRGNRYVVNREDLERLRLGKHYEAFQRLQQRIADLEEEIRVLNVTVDTLQSRLQSLQSSKSRLKRDQPITTPTPSKITSETVIAPSSPEGLVPAIQFAVDHGVDPETAKTQFKRQRIETTQERKGATHYLDELQRIEALTYWNAHNTPGFHACNDPACACQQIT
jgi:DNA repair exonuclease SbcCD ATPase subunit